MKKTMLERTLMITDILQKYQDITDKLCDDKLSIEECRQCITEVTNIMTGLRVYLKNETVPMIAHQLGQTISTSEKLIITLKRQITILEIGEIVNELSSLFKEE